MTPRFEILDARPYHCGQMARLLRAEHHRAILRIGANTHRELRVCFEKSPFRKAWMIDGRLAALGGVVGTLLSPVGLIWLAMTDEATRYPVAIVREARRQIAEIMTTRRELATTIIAGDAPSKRLAVFLGFHVAHDGLGDPAHSREGRRALMKLLDENPDLRVPIGGGHAIPMGFHYEEVA